MSRWTIPGYDNDRSRRRTRTRDLTCHDAWRIFLTGDRLRGIGRNSDRPCPVHRDRVRHGAWEVDR